MTGSLTLWVRAAPGVRRVRRGAIVAASLAAIALIPGMAAVGPAALAAGTTLYVDINSVSCSDAGTGSLAQPYCHISPAATAATAGTSVLVNTGTYLENVTVAHSGSSGSPISFAPNSGQSVTISGQLHGFTVSARSYIVISGFTITSTTGTGINVGTSSNITITGNTVTGTAGAGINVVASSSITVSNNTVTGAGQRLAPTLTQTFTAPGIQLSGTSSSLVTHNTSDNNSDHGILVSNGSANNVVSFNEASLNAEGWQRAATGISVTGTGSTGNTLLGNVTHDNEDSGLQFYTGANNGIGVENVSYNNGDHGFDNHNVTGGVITGNDTYHNCTTGINVEGTSGNFFVENNIAVDNAVYAAYNGISCSRGKGNIGVFDSSISSTTVDYNLVNLTSGSAEYAWGPALTSTTYSTVAAFHTATGQETHGLQDDPMWVNSASGDFHLQPGSPAIDSANAGAPAEPSTDIAGNPRADDPATPNTGAGPGDYDDRGAYEFQPTISDTQPPSVPTGLAATAPPKTLQVNLSWNASNDNVGVAGYTIYRGGNVLAEVSGTTVTYTDTAVVDGTTYTYAVDAFDASGNHSAHSAPASATPDATPPSVPTGLTTTSVTSSSVAFTWSASSDNVAVAGYAVFRDGSPLGTVSGSTLSYLDSTTSSGTTYSYTVEAFDAAGNDSAPSTALVVYTNDLLYLNWFDMVSPGMLNDNIHLLNTSGSTAHVSVSMPGANPINVNLAAGTETYVSFGAGHIGGPVVVTSDQAIRASQRVQYYKTFNEVWAQTAAQAATTSYINWYDKASPGMFNDNIHLLNPNGTSATVTVSVPGATSQTVTVGPGVESYVTFPAGTIGGPVKVSASQPVLASQRVQYYSSFNEVWAQSAAQAAATSYVNWYDKASPGMFNDNIHLLNPGGTSATVTVTLSGAPTQTVTVGPGAESYVTFPVGTIGGPVKVSSSQPVLASQRVQYYSTFNEVWAEGVAQAAAASHFMWYDKASPGMFNDNIHLLNPGGTSATVTVTVPGAPTQTVTIAPGAESYVTFPTGSIGGPVTVSASQPVLASQRVQYYSSFNEIWAG